MVGIKNPTYMEHIRHLFEAEDHDCMFGRGKDYTTYHGVKSADIEIYSITEPPNATMPKPKARRWDEAKSKTFLNWITNGHPRGEPKRKTSSTGTAARKRKSLSELSDDEIKLVINALDGMMAKSIDDPTSYFAIAGIHWFPNQPPNDAFCQHRTRHYHMWHRAYLLKFEDAMRTIPGCENVTLPYWNFDEKLPGWLNKKPFKNYTLPIDVHPAYPKGYVTRRHTPSQISRNFKSFGVLDQIADAFTKSRWEDFNSTIELAHDSAHPACGESLATTNVASFDPLFWFFHANWDRLWWQWQQIMQATTHWTFRSTFMDPETGKFFTAPLNRMKPSLMSSDATIDLNALGVTYTQPTTSKPPIVAAEFGSVEASRTFKFAKEPTMSVRIRNIDRLAIPGTFRVDLVAHGKSIAQRFFFQSTEPKDCDTCRKNALINLDFKVPVKELLGAKVDVKIAVFGQDGKSRAFPVSSAGNPTVNARLPLRE